jgi:hypothetical protein
MIDQQPRVVNSTLHNLLANVSPHTGVPRARALSPLLPALALVALDLD